MSISQQLEENKTDDAEKGPAIASASPSQLIASAISPQPSRLAQCLPAALFEERGIERVLPSETHPFTWRSRIQAVVLWISINLAAVNVTLGMLASTLFDLGFVDAVLCAVFGSMLGSVAVSYMATWGPRGGVRTMIFARYTMGWHPTKIIVILNLVVLLGYSMINCVVAGQILSAVSPNNSMSIVVGIIIVAVITWLVTTFGIRVFHYYERYAFIPQIIVLSILYGLSASHFDITTPSTGNPATVAGNRLSFLSLCLSAAITYSGVGADYFVYYTPKTPPLTLFCLCLTGLTTSFVFSIILGIGLASAIPATPAYATAADTSLGALLVAAFEPAGGFGRFCGVIVALGTIANTIPPTYSSGVDFQLLARIAGRVPRVVWNSVGVLIYAVCALAGRDHLSEVFTNFLALVGYFESIWIAMTLEEHTIFRWAGGRGWDWESWDYREKLPQGWAALAAFFIGWAGTVLSMDQFWFKSPIASLVGDYGADMGNYVGFAWAALVYPPLRWFELRTLGR